jgi:hypothetical protein
LQELTTQALKDTSYKATGINNIKRKEHEIEPNNYYQINRIREQQEYPVSAK